MRAQMRLISLSGTQNSISEVKRVSSSNNEISIKKYQKLHRMIVNALVWSGFPLCEIKELNRIRFINIDSERSFKSGSGYC